MMARPRMGIGTYGTINTTEVQPAKWRARTRYRYADGKARQVERFGSSRAKAESTLKQALLTIEASRGGELKPTTTLRVLGQKFLEHKRDLQRSEGTVETYGYPSPHTSFRGSETSASLRRSRTGSKNSSTRSTRNQATGQRRTVARP
jgi:hypothetical protein